MREAGPAAAAPVILVGRGGGGTRLLSEMVQELGVFLGNRLNVSFDSVEWVGTIYRLVIESLSDPIVPGSGRDRAWRREIRETGKSICRDGGLAAADPWGWKLPETTLVLPQVRRSFPSARFVHLTRHPVSSSCRRSHMTSRMDTRLGRACLTAAYRHIGRPVARIEIDPVHIHNAASWAFQVESALAALEGARVLWLTYEDLCRAPHTAEDRICRFLDLARPAGKGGVTIAADRQNSGAHLTEEAAEVWDICGPLATRLAYSFQAPQ